jgi:hypothetical protein
LLLKEVEGLRGYKAVVVVKAARAVRVVVGGSCDGKGVGMVAKARGLSQVVLVLQR